MTGPDASDVPYVRRPGQLDRRSPQVPPADPVRIAPDAARDARVAARRAEDARKAGRALDNLLQSQGAMYRNRVAAGERFIEELGDYLVSRLQHNRHYGVAACALAGDGEHDCADPTAGASCRASRCGHGSPCRGDWCAGDDDPRGWQG